MLEASSAYLLTLARPRPPPCMERWSCWCDTGREDVASISEMVDRGMSEASSTSAGAFLERAEGLRTLAESLSEIVEGGGGKLLLVTGEAGVGKTA
jgi:hypothetical protein